MSGHVLVLGASRGIGLELARAFRDAGWQVTATERHESPELRGLGVRVETGDITDRASVARLAERLADAPPLDVLLVNAGIMGPGHQDPVKATFEETALLFMTNAIGPVAAARQLGSRLAERGCVALMTSRVGSIADNQTGGFDLYRSSKSALNMLARCYALSPEGSRRAVLLLHPGWVRTTMGGPSAPLEPGESAAGLLAVIEAERHAPGLRYLDYQGRAIPW